MNGPALVRAMEASLPAMLAGIETLVNCESPSADLTAVASSADVVAEVGSLLLGENPEQIMLDGCTHIRWRLGAESPRVLLLGHHDTVWPIGSLSARPFSVADGVLRGPGCLDMKAGVVMALHATASLPKNSGVTILITGDEEVGSPSSRTLIETEALGCAAVLVLEAAAEGGALKTERKGVSLYRVGVRGHAVHAGLEPQAGVNATVELAHQVLAVTGLEDPSCGTTVTPTVLSAGTTSNTVPDSGEFSVDVRIRTAVEQERVDAAIRALRPVLDGSLLDVTGGPNRPPMEATASRRLHRRAAELAAELKLSPITGVAVGGGSDGNFTAGLGVPTLDGLGAVGGGAHAHSEHVLVAELAGRTALVAALIADVLENPGPFPATNSSGCPGLGQP